MPQVGEKRSDGKVWSGSDYGWQSTGAVWKGQKAGSKAGETRTLPGAGTKVWTGKDYGWQTKETIEKTKKGADTKAQTPSAPSAPSATPPAAPKPQAPSSSSKPSTTPSSATKPPAAKPAAKPVASSPVAASTAQKIKGGSETYKKQIASGNVKGAEETGKSTWALANPKLAAKVTQSGERKGTQIGTGQSVMAKQAAELRALRPASQAPGNEKPGYSGPPTPTAPQAQSKLAGGSYSSGATKLMSQRTKNVLGVKESYDAFDLVLEYLFSQGHVGTLDEALYVMMEMDSEMIQNIVEGGTLLPGESGKAPSSGYKEPILPGEQRKIKYQQKSAPNTSKLLPA
jgi:hypothetical protein